MLVYSWENHSPALQAHFRKHRDIFTTPQKIKLTAKGRPPPQKKRRPRPLKDPYIPQQSNFKISSYFFVLMATDDVGKSRRNNCIALMTFLKINLSLQTMSISI